MTAAMDKWIATITVSQTAESECSQAGSGPTPAPTPSPIPSQPPSQGFALKLKDGTDRYLTLDGLGKHAKAHLGDKIDGGAKWLDGPDASVNGGDAVVVAGTVLTNAAPSLGSGAMLKLDAMDHPAPCVKNNIICESISSSITCVFSVHLNLTAVVMGGSRGGKCWRWEQLQPR